jgi:hypothetical protein
MQPMANRFSNHSDHMPTSTELRERHMSTHPQPFSLKRTIDASRAEPMSDPPPKQRRQDSADKADLHVGSSRRDQSTFVPGHIAEDNPYFYVPSRGQLSAVGACTHQQAEGPRQGPLQGSNDQSLPDKV